MWETAIQGHRRARAVASCGSERARHSGVTRSLLALFHASRDTLARWHTGTLPSRLLDSRATREPRLVERVSRLPSLLSLHSRWARTRSRTCASRSACRPRCRSVSCQVAPRHVVSRGVMARTCASRSACRPRCRSVSCQVMPHHVMSHGVMARTCASRSACRPRRRSAHWHVTHRMASYARGMLTPPERVPPLPTAFVLHCIAFYRVALRCCVALAYRARAAQHAYRSGDEKTFKKLMEILNPEVTPRNTHRDVTNHA